MILFPARRGDFTEVTGSNQFPLPFCGTRWVEDEKVALRAINVWENVCKYVSLGISTKE